MTDTKELLALRDSGASVLSLEAGRVYTYDDDRWLHFGDRAVVIEGRGATLSTLAPDRRVMPMAMGPLLWDGRGDGVLGDRIASVPAGATDLVLLEQSQIFEPGDLILIAGFLQQLTEEIPPRSWGWPPNFRHFEVRTVRSVLPRRIELSDPLELSYDETWPEYDGFAFNTPYVFGAPRVWRWAHPDGRRPNRSLTIRDTTFRGGDTRKDGVFSTTGIDLRLERCTLEMRRFWPTVCRSVAVADCTLNAIELDKICERFSMTGGTVLVRVGGTGAGVRSLHFERVLFHNFVQLVVQETEFSDCTCLNALHIAAKGALPARVPVTLSGTFRAVGDLRPALPMIGCTFETFQRWDVDDSPVTFTDCVFSDGLMVFNTGYDDRNTGAEFPPMLVNLNGVA